MCYQKADDITYDADNDGTDEATHAPVAKRVRLEAPLVQFFKSKFRATYEEVRQQGQAIIDQISKAPPHYRDPAVVAQVDLSEYLDAKGARAQLYQISYQEAMGNLDGTLNAVTMIGSAAYTAISTVCRHRFLAIQQQKATTQDHLDHEKYLNTLVEKSLEHQMATIKRFPGSTWGELMRMPLAVKPPCVQNNDDWKRVAGNYAN